MAKNWLKLRRLTRPLMIALALLGPAHVQARTQPAPKTASAQATANSLVPPLWEVHVGKHKAYVFGTIHTLPRGTDWFKPHVVKALDESKRLVLETQVPEHPSAIAPVINRLARSPREIRLEERVPENWRPTLRAAIERLKPGPLDWYDTWFVALTLTNLQAEADGLDPRIGVEAVLSERARMRDLPITGLETAEEQLTNFDALTEADQRILLLSTLEGLDNSKSTISLLIGDWMLGNSDALAQQINQGFDRSPMLRRLLMEDRNVRWADWLVKQMSQQEGPLFVAVGAGHLAGKGSFLEELERRGAKVVRVSSQPAKATRKRRN